jgi:type IV secretory pathway TraG/TraD family ATPase VirD4
VSRTVDREPVLPDGIGALLLGLVAGAERAGLVGALFATGHPVVLSFPAAAATPGRLPDEICNGAPLPTLGEYASSGAGQGVLLLSAIQDYSQAIDTWGRERAATIISNHRGKLFCSGIADPATFEYVDHVLGREELERKSRTREAFGGTPTTSPTELRPIAPPHRLRQAKFGTALLLHGELPPVRAEQRLFFERRPIAIAATDRGPDRHSERP